MGRRRTALALISLCGIPLVGQAEVRLIPSGGHPRVDVRMTAEGPWTPLGRSDRFTLNPAGDQRSESAPSVAYQSSQALVAWSAPSDARIRLALGEGGWEMLPERATSEAPSKPFVTKAASFWIVAWSSGSPRQASFVMLSPSGTEIGAEELGEGEVLGVVATGSTVHFVLRNASELRVVMAYFPAPDPTPVLFRSFQITPFAASGAPVNHLFQHSDGSIGTALVWWTSTTSLSYIELTEDGPVLPVRSLTANGNGAKYPQSLVNEALRDLGR